MTKVFLFALAIACMPMAVCAQEVDIRPHGENAPESSSGLRMAPSTRVVGVVHRNIAASSPVASGSLTPAQQVVNVGSIIKVHLTVKNLSSHDLEFEGPFLDTEVFTQDGKLAPETEQGCLEHFFSPCHTERTSTAAGPYGAIPKGGMREIDDYLNGQYKLGPGIYTAVGYVCNIKEGPECFKTNTIEITVK